MHVCMHACMYVCMYVCINVCLSVCLSVCMYVSICMSMGLSMTTLYHSGHTKPGERVFTRYPCFQQKFFSGTEYGTVYSLGCAQRLWHRGTCEGERQRNSVKLADEVVNCHLALACHWTLIMDIERVVQMLHKLTSL